MGRRADQVFTKPTKAGAVQHLEHVEYGTRPGLTAGAGKPTSGGWYLLHRILVGTVVCAVSAISGCGDAQPGAGTPTREPSQGPSAATITAVCPLVPPDEVGRLFGLTKLTARESPPLGSLEAGTLNLSCSYANSSYDGVELGVSLYSGTASPEEALLAVMEGAQAVSGGQSGLARVDGLGDAAAFRQGKSSASLVAVKRAKGHQRVVHITTEVRPGIRDAAVKLARRVLAQI